MELNVDTVLVAVNDLHASTGRRVFTLIEIAEALSDGQRVIPPGRHGPTDAQGNPIPGLSPPVPAWVKALNEILLHLGEEGKLPVMQTAMVVFLAESARHPDLGSDARRGLIGRSCRLGQGTQQSLSFRAASLPCRPWTWGVPA